MGGLGILIVIVLYFAIAIFVVRKIPTRWGKAIAALFAVLLPTGDALWGRYVTLPKLCQDAGLKVFKHASKEDGLMLGLDVNDYWIIKYGITFVEGQYGDKKFYRISVSDGKPLLEKNVEPNAKYISKMLRTNPRANYWGNELTIESRRSAEVIARLRTYGFGGGWAERFLGGFADSGPQSAAECHLAVPFSSESLIQETFK